MIEQVSLKIANRLCKGLSISRIQYDSCRYGIETLLYTILSTLGLLCFGLYLHQGINALIIVLTFYINQTLGGGFHASSHFKCFATMALFLLLGLVFCAAPVENWVFILISIISIIVLTFIPLLLHKNRKYLANQTLLFTKRSKHSVLLQAIALFVCSIINVKFIKPIAAGLAISALSRVIAKMQTRNYE